MTFPRGSVLPIHHVNCEGCGVPLERKTYWRHPKCGRCARRGVKGREAKRMLLLRHQARRYRILLHDLGYEDNDFDELRAEIQRSILAFRDQPETREARVDLKIERRSRKRVAAAFAPTSSQPRSDAGGLAP